MKKEEYRMKKEEFYFDSWDGVSRIHAVRYMPEDGRVVGVLQIIHGMSEYVERYEELAEFFTARNFAVVGEDHLGHGKSVGQEGQQGYFCAKDPARAVVEDNHKLHNMTRELYPGVPYLLLGHSMGSFILRNYICRYSRDVEGAIIVGTGMQPLWLMAVSHLVAALQKIFLGERHVSHFLDKGAMGGYNKRIEPLRTPKDWLSTDEEIVDRYIADPDCGFVFTVNGFKALFTLVGRARKGKELKKIRKDLPVLLISGEEDPVGEYGKGVARTRDALKRAGLEQITMKLYPGKRHELLNEVGREQVREEIYQWLCQELPL